MIALLATAETIAFQKTPLVTFGYIMQVLISLSIVLGLLWVSSKYLLPRLNFTPKGRMIEVIDRIAIEPGLSAYVLKAKNKNYFIVSGQKGTVLLDAFEEGE